MSLGDPETDDSKDHEMADSSVMSDRNHNTSSNVQAAVSNALQQAQADVDCAAAGLNDGGHGPSHHEHAADPETGYVAVLVRCPEHDSQFMTQHLVRFGHDEEGVMTKYYRGYEAVKPNESFPPSGFNEWAEQAKGKYCALLVVEGDVMAKVCTHLISVGDGWHWLVLVGTGSLSLHWINQCGICCIQTICTCIECPDVLNICGDDAVP